MARRAQSAISSASSARSVRNERDALVSVFDRGFLYGDSIYEVTRTAGGRPVDLDRHLGRLERQAEGLVKQGVDI